MIVAAMIICDRKLSSQMIGLPAIAEIQGISRIYVNIETDLTSAPTDDLPSFQEAYKPMMDFLKEVTKTIFVDMDIWSWRSTWRGKPRYDQDQRRLAPIVFARNQARQYALDQGMSHLLFIDADVIPQPDGLEKLLALEHPITGGLVPGRGAHSHVNYVFHEFHPGDPRRKRLVPPVRDGRGEIVEQARLVDDDPPDRNVIVCAHGTCGYLLLERNAFSSLSFRSGVSREDWKTGLSEDPALASDLYLNGFGRWWIHKDVKAAHWSDPKDPLTPEGVCNDEEIPK